MAETPRELAARVLAEAERVYSMVDEDQISNATLARLISDLARAVRDSLEESTEAMPVELEENRTYELVLRVRATVVDSLNNAQFQLQLDRRDYLAGREVYVDLDEVVSAEEVTER